MLDWWAEFSASRERLRIAQEAAVADAARVTGTQDVRVELPEEAETELPEMSEQSVSGLSVGDGSIVVGIERAISKGVRHVEQSGDRLASRMKHLHSTLTDGEAYSHHTEPDPMAATLLTTLYGTIGLLRPTTPFNPRAQTSRLIHLGYKFFLLVT